MQQMLSLRLARQDEWGMGWGEGALNSAMDSKCFLSSLVNVACNLRP